MKANTQQGGVALAVPHPLPKYSAVTRSIRIPFPLGSHFAVTVTRSTAVPTSGWLVARVALWQQWPKPAGAAHDCKERLKWEDKMLNSQLNAVWIQVKERQ